MGVRQSRPYRLSDTRNLRPIQLPLAQTGLKRHPLHKFHYQVRATLVFGKIINWDNVGMFQLGNHARLALEARKEVWIFHKGRMQSLDRHVTIQRRVVSLEHRRHTTLAKLLQHLIGTNRLTHHKRHLSNSCSLPNWQT